nr:copia protein [Tanacetum cinerariifolium]
MFPVMCLEHPLSITPLTCKSIYGLPCTFEESIDSGFDRFNTIITSLKALDESFSSKNYVKNFLRDLHPKWRGKVTAIEESKDLSSLALDDLISNLKVHKIVMEKDFEIYKGKKEKVKSIALKAKKESSNDETVTSESDDEEYAMAVRNFKKFFRRKGKFVRQPREEKKSFRQRDEKKVKSDQNCFRCGNPNHLIGDCPKPSRNKDQMAFNGGSWSDSENDTEDKTNDATCLMAQSSNEVWLRTCLEPNEWIKDSGCSKHMTGNKSLFSTYKAYDRDGIFFNKSKYVKEMLKKFGLEDSKPTKTPMSMEIKLTKYDEADSVDSSKIEKQTTLAISKTEAEYVFAEKACQQALWMKQALIDYGIRLDDVPIMCENQGAIDLSKNPVQHSRTKHIEIRHHFLRDNIQKGNISIEKVASENNIADIFTKPLKREVFNYLRLRLGMIELIMDIDSPSSQK